MHRQKPTLSFLVIAGAFALLAAGEPTAAQLPLGSTFTYQGELTDGGTPVRSPIRVS